jgi:hypothetical protein
MKPCGNGRFCGSCQKVVVDFTDKTLDEIHDYFNAHKGQHTCGHFHVRHTTRLNAWFSFLNYLEFALAKVKLQKVAMLLIGVLLFITGCKTTKATMHGGSRFLDRDKKPTTTVKQAYV